MEFFKTISKARYSILLISLILASCEYFFVRKNTGLFVSSLIAFLLATTAFSHLIDERLKDKPSNIPYMLTIILYGIGCSYIYIAFASLYTSRVSTIEGCFLFLGFFFFLTITTKAFKLGKSLLPSTFDEKSLTSYFNPIKIVRGFRWSKFEDVAKTLDTGIIVDNFEIIDSPTRVSASDLAKLKATKMKLKTSELTKTLIGIGKAGSGKTEFFLSIAKQNTSFEFFKRELYHDVKGDFTQKLYNPNTDYILNPYDTRGLIWDMWTDMQHNEALITSFITNLLESQVDKPDFWTTSATKLMTESIMRVHFTYVNTITSAEKWVKLLEVLKEYENTIYDDKTKQSIWQTLDLGMEYIKMLAFETQFGSGKLFSIYEWTVMNNTRLFLLNNASYSKKLNPYFTGFLACIIEVLLSKPDTKSDFTLLLLDEYLSLKLDETVRLKLMTQIRSKGGCVVLGVQYLDANDKKQKQLVGSSTYAKFLFNVADDETVDTFVKAYGNVEYEQEKISTSTSNKEAKNFQVKEGDIVGAFASVIPTGGNGKNVSKTSTIEDKSRGFLTPEMIKGLSDYKHITFIDELGIYYAGYTERVEFEALNSHFEKKDLSPYYQWIFTLNDSKKNVEKIVLKEDKKVEKTEEEITREATVNLLNQDFLYQFEIYEALEKCLMEENQELMEKTIIKYNLENIDIDEFIDKFELIAEEYEKIVNDEEN